jgi:hypothetical protein
LRAAQRALALVALGCMAECGGSLSGPLAFGASSQRFSPFAASDIFLEGIRVLITSGNSSSGCGAADAGDDSFQVVQINLYAGPTSPVAVGTYPLRTTTLTDAGPYYDTASLFYYGYASYRWGSGTNYEASSGTVTVTSLDPNRIRGTFSAEMQPLEDGGLSRLTGSFDAASCGALH